MSTELCRSWTQHDPLLEEYHDHEWCKVHHDDRFEFEMLSLEGASTGLSWQLILHKRKAYQDAFHNFDIALCAAMSDTELDDLMHDEGIIRNHSKIYSVRNNARAVLNIQKEYGSFDTYLWHFTDNKVIDGKWKKPEDIPAVTDLSRTISKDMKKHGIKYAGPVITYSFMQATGIVNDHLVDCKYR